MKELKDKIISLGVARGYLPEYFEENGDKQFITQYLRLLKEIGEAADEVRAGNKKAFEMELGDCLVLLTNLDYIADTVGIDSNLYELHDGTHRSVYDLESATSLIFQTHYMNEVAEERCLKLAYDKIVSRGGMLINGDWFKPSDREYQEAKLNEKNR